MSAFQICVRNYSTRVARIGDVSLKNATWGQERASWSEEYTGLIAKLMISSNALVRSSITPVHARQSYHIECRLEFDDASGERYGSVSFSVGATPVAGNQWSPFSGVRSRSRQPRLLVTASAPLAWYGGYLVSLTILDASREASPRLGGLVRTVGSLLDR